MKMNFFSIVLIFMLSINLNAQQIGTFKDPRDGKIYKTVKIGHQLWMAENLNYNAGSGSWYCMNNSSNGSKYGRLYNWETAKKVCPTGWHLPSKGEFETLMQKYGGKGTSFYSALIENGNSGFNALFGGYRYENGTFEDIGYNGGFWSSTEEAGRRNDVAWGMFIHSDTKEAYVDISARSFGFSVRCVKD